MGCCNSNNNEKSEFILHEQNGYECQTPLGCDSPNFKYTRSLESESPKSKVPMETPKFGLLKFHFRESLESEDTCGLQQHVDSIIKSLETDLTQDSRISNKIS